MRIFRYILSSLLLLAFAVAGSITGYLYFLYEGKIPLIVILADTVTIAGTRLTVGHAAIAVTVVFFFLALLAWPRRKPDTKVRRKAMKESRTMPDKMEVKTTGQASQASGQQSGSVDFDQPLPKPPPSRAESIESQDPSTYARLEDPHAMARLVAIDQGEMSREVVTELCNKYYPKLIELVSSVEEDDNTSLETLGKHIISIARNRLKLTDKELSDNQFSIFQEKVFNDEKEPFLQIYLPMNVSNLNDQQRAFLGKIADKRAWESIQRRIRAERADWRDLSLENAWELLLKTKEMKNEAHY